MQIMLRKLYCYLHFTTKLWFPKVSKSHLKPIQCLKILSTTVDSNSKTVTLPSGKASEILDMVNSTLTKGFTDACFLA